MADIDTALRVMLDAHAGQVDKAGRPYVLHPMRVMQRLATDDERMVALMHDVVEDSPMTLAELSAMGFSPAVVDAVDRLTKREGQSYDQFLDRVLESPLATRVKIADISDNIDVTRLASMDDKDLARIGKYHAALKRLEAARV